MFALLPVLTQLSGNYVVPEIILGYHCDLYVVTPRFQIRIAVYSLKTVVTEIIAMNLSVIAYSAGATMAV